MSKKTKLTWTNHISIQTAAHVLLDSLDPTQKAEAAAKANDTALRSAGYIPGARASRPCIAKQPVQRYNKE